MNIVMLNGRPVMRGTKLDYVDAEKKKMWGDDYLTVTDVGPHLGVDYVGNAGEIHGNITLRELPNVFKHYEEVSTETDGIRTFAFSHISDLLTVPNELLDTCLDELKIALRTVRLGVTAQAEQISDDLRCKFAPEDFQVLARRMLPVLVWQDDGKNKTQVNISGESMTVEHTKAVPKDEDLLLFKVYHDGMLNGTIKAANKEAAQAAAEADYVQNNMPVISVEPN